MTDTDKSLVWVIDGSLSKQLHKSARLDPASALCSLGWKVTMITSGAFQDHVDTRIEFRVLPWPKIYLLGSLVYHLSIVYSLMSKKIQSNVLMFHPDHFSFMLPIIFWSKSKPGRNMAIVMDTRTMPMDTTSVKGKLRVLCFRFSHWLAAHLSVSQTAITREMVNTVGIPEKRLLGVWPSGVNTERFSTSLQQRRWPNSQGPVNLMYLGTLRSERCLRKLIDAVILTRESGLNVTLEIVGDGPQREELERYALLKGNTAIKISPRVPHRDIPFVLSRAHVGVLPFPDLPHFRVSSAIKLYEYLASGIPVLATAIVAHTAVLGNANFAFWAENASPESLASAIREVWECKQKLGELGTRAVAFTHNRTWEASAKRLSDALIKGIENNHRS